VRGGRFRLFLKILGVRGEGLWGGDCCGDGRGARIVVRLVCRTVTRNPSLSSSSRVSFCSPSGIARLSILLYMRNLQYAS
jgi:hypothetical protein